MIRIMKYGEVPNSELFARTMPTMNVEAVVADILKNVKERGDEALREYTSRFDGAEPDSLTVTPEEMEEAGGRHGSIYREHYREKLLRRRRRDRRDPERRIRRDRL